MLYRLFRYYFCFDLVDLFSLLSSFLIIFEMSHSSSSVCASVSDSEIFRTVRKDSDDRLRNELKRAQDFYSLELIDSMTRD